MPGAIAYREATAADAAAIASVIAEGFATYEAFAPGWAAPEDMVAGVGARLAAPDVWATLALDDGEAVGVAGTSAARDHAVGPHGPLLDGVGHVWAVFVRRRLWGAGVATELLARAVERLRAEGHAQARLFVAAGHARARAFYAREGWRDAGPAAFDARLGLDVVELRRGL